MFNWIKKLFKKKKYTQLDIDLPKVPKSVLLSYIKPEWHNEFLQYIETGKASKEFRNYLDTDKGADIATTMRCNDICRVFGKIGRIIRQLPLKDKGLWSK